MKILEHIGAGTVPPEQTIKIESIELFNMAMNIKGAKDTRLYLNHLLIDPVEKTLTASNGFSLITTPDALSFSEYIGIKKLLIKPERMLPKDCLVAVINITRKTITAYGRKNGRLTIGFETLDSQYPDFSEILNSINDSTISKEDVLCFDPMLLRKMNKYSGTNMVIITQHKSTEGSDFLSVRFLGLFHEYKAILMPARV